MSQHAPPATALDGAAFSFGIAAARYNLSLVDALLQTVLARLTAAGVKERKITLVRVPGSHELPVAAQWLAERAQRDCVIALGVLLRGGTTHNEIVAQGVTNALQQVALATRRPVINGVIVADTLKQAEERCVGAINRGAEFARAALEMAALRREIGGRP
jgi:6,7-dimethyl-8-ribityllumazine synthase